MVYFSSIGVKRRICRESFFDFCKETWHILIPQTPVWNWHIEKMCNELQDCAERVFNNKPSPYDLVINVPPGTTKSTVVSTLFHPWVWSVMPKAQFITASHTENLVLQLSTRSRNVIESEFYKTHFNISLSPNQNQKQYYENTAGGWRLSATVGGKSPVGFHAHFCTVDDPIDPEKAVSAPEIETARKFVVETIPSRKVDKAVAPTILVMQRLVDEDPSGVMLQQPNVRHICLPALLTPNVKPAAWAKYYKDNVLDPIRLSSEMCERIRQRVGNLVFARQYLQDTVPAEGNIFKVEELKRLRPPKLEFFKKLVRFWDKAATEGAGAYTVGVLMGVDNEDKIWILDVIRGQWDTGQREKIIKQTAKIDGRRVIVGLEQEPGSGGKESALATAKRLSGYVVSIVRPTGDKASRAIPFSSQVNLGNVHLKQAPWNRDYISELRSFTMDSIGFKDQVDASSGGFSVLFFTTGRKLGRIKGSAA